MKIETNIVFGEEVFQVFYTRSNLNANGNVNLEYYKISLDKQDSVDGRMLNLIYLCYTLQAYTIYVCHKMCV